MPALLVNNQIIGNTLNSGCFYPDYTKRTALYEYTEDVIEQYFTVENDGYIQLNVRTNKTVGTPFYRLFINGSVVEEGYGHEGVYSYRWSSTVFVRKGDVVVYTMTTKVTNGDMYSAFFFIPQTIAEKVVSSEGAEIGTTDISTVGYGTVTGAIETLKEMVCRMWIGAENANLYGIGKPNDGLYPADKYVRLIYLDVINGILYYATQLKGYCAWVQGETLKSVSNSILSTVSECTASTTPTDIAGASAVAELNDRLNAKSSKYWTNLGKSDFLTKNATDYTSFSINDISTYSEVLILLRHYSNVIESITLPLSLFKILNNDSTRVLIGGKTHVKYINSTSIGAQNYSDIEFISIDVYAR